MTKTGSLSLTVARMLEPQTLVPTAGGTCLDFFVTDDGGGIGVRFKNEPTEFLGAVEAMDALKGIVVSFHPVELCDVLLLELGGSRSGESRRSCVAHSQEGEPITGHEVHGVGTLGSKGLIGRDLKIQFSSPQN